jgi:soluble lytic murein transglycosylase
MRLAVRYDVAREAGDGAAETATALTLLDDHRAFPEAEACALEVTGPLRGPGSSAAVSTELLLACAETFAARDRTDDLRRVLRALDQRGMKGRDAEHRRLLWGEYHYETGNPSRAIALARPTYTDDAYRRRSMILLARAFREAGRKADAAAVYEQYARDFPNDSLASDALYAAASLREQNGQAADSARLLDELRHAYPSSFQGWAAAMQRANELQKDGDVAQAVEIFEQWLARSRRTDEAALFYLSRLYEGTSSGEDAGLLLDELRRVNPYSFYVSPDVARGARGPLRDATGTLARSGAGSLSSWLAGAAGERARAYDRVVAAAASDHTETMDDVPSREALERGRRFLDAGFRDWAERELEIVRRRPGISPDVALALARTYEEYAMPWRSVRAFERARVALPWETRREFADDFRYLLYPLPFPAHVLDAAAQSTVPAHLIYAIMREESRFETDVVSRAGAVGLMQLMPDTARRVARSKELGIDVDDRLGDPGVNVAIGTWYASDLLRQGDGSVAWMLAAYNAGPGAAKRWLEPGVAGEDAIAAVESIDYRETRGYVKRVVESANVYQALYFGTSAKNAPR